MSIERHLEYVKLSPCSDKASSAEVHFESSRETNLIRKIGGNRTNFDFSDIYAVAKRDII